MTGGPFASVWWMETRASYIQGEEAYGEPPASLRALVTVVTTVVITQEVSSKVKRLMWAQLLHGGGTMWWKRTYHFMMNREQRERGISEGQGRKEPKPGPVTHFLQLGPPLFPVNYAITF